MAIKKKAFFFTLMSILFVSIFIVVFTASTTIQQEKLAGSSKAQTMIVNEFTKNLKQDFLEDALYFASHNAILATLEYMELTNEHIDNFPEFIDNLTKTGGIKKYNKIDSYTVGTDEILFNISIIDENGTDIGTTGYENFCNDLLFGNTQVVMQSFRSPYTGTISNIEIYLENRTANSEKVYIMLYNETFHLLAKSRVLYTEDRNYNFSFNKNAELIENDDYYIIISAPFTDGITNYVTCNTNLDELADAGFSMRTVDSLFGSLDIQWPIDFIIEKEIMGSGNMNEMIGALESLSTDYLNINTDIEFTNITFTQEINEYTVTTSTDFTINTSKGTLSFDIEHPIEQEFSIIGMKEPIALVQGYDNNGIIIQNNTPQGVDEVLEFIDAHNFTFNALAPSFIQRFSADNTPSTCCGIESFVPIIGDEYYSYADYMYTYPEGDCGGDGELYNVSGISDGGTNYKLDDDHLEQYGLEGIRNDC